MENLKQLLEKRKQPNDSQWQKKSDLNKHHREQYMKDQAVLEKQREEKLVKKMKIIEDFYSVKQVDTEELVKLRKLEQLKDPTPKDCKTPEPLSPRIYEPDEQEPKPPMEKKEVVDRLRQLGQVVTYFGETEFQRYKRLQQLEQSLMETFEGTVQSDGPRDSKQIAEELKLRLQASEESIQSFLMKLNKQDDPIVNPEKHYQHRQAREFEQELLKEGNYESKCDDVYVWCKNILKQWELKLMEKYDNETKKRSLEGSKAIGTYNQSMEYIKPLTEMLKKRKINEEILKSLYCIIRYCVLKEYVRAHDKYLELAIGNAPWPMGVTMVGIHERTGRAKIFSSQIAHILNDETQRKYIQSIKRLITFSQKFYPNPDPSKMVDFRCEVTL